MSDTRKRLDLALVETGLVRNRQRARALIMAGKVLVNDLPIDKPGVQVLSQDMIRLKGEDIAYVGRGGLKLEAALQHFEITVKNLVCMDVGASTGGFTDCLLQHGAQRVYAVDVGYGQLAWKLRQDPRVVVIDRTNIRHMAPDIVPRPIDLVTIDVSFISLKIVVPAVLKFIKAGSQILSLIKPQFEVGKGHVGKGGLVKDPLLHDKVISDLSDYFSQLNLAVESVIPSPIRGAKGNREFLIFSKMVLS